MSVGTAQAAHVVPFDRRETAHDASTFGMWVFLASEIMFFGAIFTAYVLTRLAHPQAFAAASRLTDFALGTTNTAVLLTSSFTIALAARATTLRQLRLSKIALAATIALGLVFLAIKGTEYAADIAAHRLPGADFRYEGTDPRGVQLFFGLYFVTTGFHALHLLIGIGLVGTVIARLERWRADVAEHTTELVALYWHLVDIVWIFLYPLLYLVSRVPS